MMSKERKGEIAFLIIKEKIRKKGLSNLRPNAVRREAGNQAKALGVHRDELIEFMWELSTEVISEALGR